MKLYTINSLLGVHINVMQFYEETEEMMNTGFRTKFILGEGKNWEMGMRRHHIIGCKLFTKSQLLF